MGCGGSSEANERAGHCKYECRVYSDNDEADYNQFWGSPPPPRRRALRRAKQTPIKQKIHTQFSDDDDDLIIGEVEVIWTKGDEVIPLQKYASGEIKRFPSLRSPKSFESCVETASNYHPTLCAASTTSTSGILSNPEGEYAFMRERKEGEHFVLPGVPFAESPITSPPLPLLAEESHEYFCVNLRPILDAATL